MIYSDTNRAPCWQQREDDVGLRSSTGMWRLEQQSSLAVRLLSAPINNVNPSLLSVSKMMNKCHADENQDSIYHKFSEVSRVRRRASSDPFTQKQPR